MKELLTADYSYELPQDRIAIYPLKERDQSRMLIFKDGQITHSKFYELPELLPKNAFLFFNNTKVIPARLHFQKETGADIEIFLLDPVTPSALVPEAMQATITSSWHCTIGNLKRWTDRLILRKECTGFTLNATLVDRERSIVKFEWDKPISFAEAVAVAGETPLPPYLKRSADETDRDTYQTIYSRHEGAVAAPTAGLHFTDSVFQKLRDKNIEHDFLTLHVSAGTFQPIKEPDANDHTMHREQVIVSRTNIENLLKPDRFLIPVGTTSMRTMESIYWYGVRLLKDPKAVFDIHQDEPYSEAHHPEKTEALNAVLLHMKETKTETLIGETSIFIRPGYRFKLSDALITNFHQPGSTLLLLVAAFTGKNWKEIYSEALKNNYRFLSYGDSSLLFPENR